MQQRKKVVVVGANGNISREIIPLLIKKYEVYSVVRSPPEFAINSINLKFIEGDALSPDLWEEWLEGMDAVVSCFGTRKEEADSKHVEFIKLLIDKMRKKGVKRLISFFTHGALKSNDGTHVYQKEDYADKEKAKCHAQCIAALADCELNYTAICLWKFQKGQKQVEASQGWSQSEADSEGVAKFIESEIDTPYYERKVVFVHNK